MPALYALGRKPALADVQKSLRLGEPLFPFLDDTNFVNRRLDPCGDHRAACARNHGRPLERAAAQVCREAGARVTVNSCLADMNLPVDLGDGRLEVVANGLPLWNGARSRHFPLPASPADMLAVLTGPPCARPGAGRSAPTRSCCDPNGAALSCLPSRSGAGGALKRAASSAASLVRELAPRRPSFSLQSCPLSLPVGPPCSRLPPTRLSRSSPSWLSLAWPVATLCHSVSSLRRPPPCKPLEQVRTLAFKKTA